MEWNTTHWDKDARESEMDKTRPESLRGDDALRRGGGEDFHRATMRNVIDRKVSDHSQSGYNLQDRPQMETQAASWKRFKEGEVESRGTIEPDGLFRY